MPVSDSDKIKDKVKYKEFREMGMRKERAVRLANANATYEQAKKKKDLK